MNSSKNCVNGDTSVLRGKGRNSTLYKIKTPERISTKFGIVDYFREMCMQTKFGDNQMSGDSAKTCEIYDLCDFMFPERSWGPYPTNFHARWLNDVHSRADVPFCSKHQNFFKPRTQGQTAINLALLGRDFENFRFISPLTSAVCEVNTSSLRRLI